MDPAERIAAAVRDGGILLTANQRLARTLRQAYDQRQRRRGQTAWPSPVILPLGVWLRARWSEALLAGAVPPALLLSASRETILWQRIIGASPEAASLLDLRGTAQSAMEAWRLLHQYRLPLDGRFLAHEDWAAFHAWAGDYRRACDASGWLDDARLPDTLEQPLAKRQLDLPRHLLLAGFDEFTPQQMAILEALGQAGCPHSTLETATLPAAPRLRPCRDQDEELRAAARWAGNHCAQHPGATVGIVLLDPAVPRTRLERIFDEALHPESLPNPRRPPTAAFHISLPDPLHRFPLVNAALLMLRLAPRERWDLAQASQLLRSPFLGGGGRELAVRASLDATLRQRRRARVPVRSIAAHATRCPRLADILEQWRALAPTLDGPRLPSAWTTDFRRILDAAGWPGDRVLSSPEFQVLEAWNGLLDEFASLEPVAGPLVLDEALSRLDELAAETRFQPRDPGALIQIIGPLEAAGARFDALWICGATDSAWPASAHPHPFLPIALQREHRLPHSSPEREVEFALRTFERLRSSAPQMIVSWPGRSIDAEFRPSPLLDGLPEWGFHLDTSAPAPAPAPCEQILDQLGPVLETNRPWGGTSVLKAQSACPFQAFAARRLHARELENGELGLSSLDRGIEVHHALLKFWEQVGEHATLLRLPAAELRAVAARAVESAAAQVLRDTGDPFEQRFRHIETGRLTALLLEWAEIEKQRAPFTVKGMERAGAIEIGGLQFDLRIDRVDELPGGAQVILDYKATAPSTNAWLGDRPEEPQLPLYAIASKAPLGGIAFAQVCAGDLRFKGFGDSPGLLPACKTFPVPVDEQRAHWRRVLEQLAVDFRTGVAAVDPLQFRGAQTCQRCRRQSLCRVQELAPADPEAADAGA